MKRIIATILALLALVALPPSAAYAAEATGDGAENNRGVLHETTLWGHRDREDGRGWKADSVRIGAYGNTDDLKGRPMWTASVYLYDGDGRLLRSVYHEFDREAGSDANTLIDPSFAGIEYGSQAYVVVDFKLRFKDDTNVYGHYRFGATNLI